MKRIVIIDDESKARQVIRFMIASLCPDVEICGEADGVESGYQLIRQTKPLGVLLDISMEDGTGFDLLDKFPNPTFQVIFTTAYDEFALKAFRYHALDYLLKPIDAVELAQAIDRLKKDFPKDYQRQISNLLESHQAHRLDKITLTTQEGMIFLKLSEIVRLESEGNYTTFHLANDDKHLISRPINHFEELLPVQEFFRLHQSHIVNLNMVRRVLREDGGSALMADGCKVPIARRRKEEFLEAMKPGFS